MSIIKSIEKARERGASDDNILSEIIKQNPDTLSSVEEATNRGASSSAIIEEIIKQSSKGANKQIKQKEPEKNILRKGLDFFTGSTQKFAETLGTAASVIDPYTRKMREETLSSQQKQTDRYLEMAKNEKDKERKTKLLQSAEALADTEDVDIFNNPEYQKTAKQVYGEAIGTAAETIGWSKLGNLVKSVKGATMGQTALKSALTGGGFGALLGASDAMSEDKTGGEIAMSFLGGGLSGAALGGAGGAIAGRLAGLPSTKKIIHALTGKLTPTKKTTLYRSGQLKEATFLRGEKYLPNERDLRLGKLAKDVGIKGKSNSADIAKVNNAITEEATKLKKVLKDSGAIFNKNNIKGALNKMRAEKTVDLIPDEEKVYDKMIMRFTKKLENRSGRKIDNLLELRQEFDKWARANNPNIFKNKTGGSYRALISVRDTINNYINSKIKNDFVKQSLNKQHNLFTILDNISEVSSVKTSQLRKAGYIKPTRQLLKWAALAGGGYLFGKQAGMGGQDFGSQ